MNTERACWNCSRKYLCSWEPAGDEWSCRKWQHEKDNIEANEEEMLA